MKSRGIMKRLNYIKEWVSSAALSDTGYLDKYILDMVTEDRGSITINGYGKLDFDPLKPLIVEIKNE
jgi:hypothetical protein